MRGAPRGARNVTKAPFRQRRCYTARTIRSLRNRTRVRLHQPVRQTGNGGSFSNFYYGRRRGPMTSAFKANAANYYSINGASPINIGVGVQTVTTVNCMYGAYGNTVANDLQQLFNAVTGGNLTNRMLLQSVS